MTRKLLIFLVCVVIASSSFVTAYAKTVTVSGEYYYGVYEEEEGLDPDFPLFSLFALDRPNYNFDLSKIDFYTDAPQQVLDIYKMSVQSVGTEESPNTSARNPFVCVIVTSDRALLFVGCNVGIYNRSTRDTMTNPRFGIGYESRVKNYDFHCCYMQTFDYNGNVKNKWQNLPDTVHGKGAIHYFGGWATPDDARDIYVYGANAPFCGNFTNLTVADYDSSTGSGYQFDSFNNCNKNGFTDAPAFYPDVFKKFYFGMLTVPTYEQWQASQDQKQHEETGSWISRLGDRISGFFETLKNWLLWFSAEGSASYTNPFSNILTDIQSFFDQQVSDTNDFKNSLSDTLDNVVGYISSGSGVISAVLTGVPILSAFVAFFVVFSVIRKVVGR